MTFRDAPTARFPQREGYPSYATDYNVSPEVVVRVHDSSPDRFTLYVWSWQRQIYKTERGVQRGVDRALQEVAAVKEAEARK